MTLSYSILRNSGRGGLIGSSESDRGNGFITFHHNLYENIDSRTPLLRGGDRAHLQQLVRAASTSRASTPGPARKAKVENNYFKNSKDVLGTFYTERGRLLAGQREHLRQRDLVGRGQREPTRPARTWRPTPRVSIPYSYSLDGGSCVPDVVSQTAGANNGLQGVERQLHADQTPAPTTARPTTPAPSPTPRADHHRRPTSDRRAGPTSASVPAPTAPARPAAPATATSDRRQPEHLLVADRLDRRHLDQVGLRHQRSPRSTSARRPARPAASAPGRSSTPTPARC